MRLAGVMMSGGWVTLLLVVLGIILLTPHAMPFKTQDGREHVGGLPRGWATEAGSRGKYCRELWAQLESGQLHGEFDEPRSEHMPWGEEHVYSPPDYRALVVAVCEAEAAGTATKAAMQQQQQKQGDGNSPFVTRAGRELVVNGAALRWVGFNAPQLLSLAADPPGIAETAELMMSNAAKLGLRVARVWAFRDGYDWRPPAYRQQAFAPLQVRPGVYNETMFRALDEVLAAAGRSGVLVTLTLSNWHHDYGGVEAYAKWVLGGSDLAAWSVHDFYADPRARALFKANLGAMAGRVNSVTGVAYRDDPTILSWDLINEPRCSACPGPSKAAALHAWVAEMAGFMKAADPRHLVTVSGEGYFGESSAELMLANPGLWAVCEGLDYAQLYALPALDYGAAHLYMEMKGWDDYAGVECDARCALDWSRHWLQAHVNVSDAALHKPFVLEEFGLPRALAGSKDELFSLVYDQLRTALQDGRAAVAGSNFWAAAVRGEPDWDGYYLYLDGGLPGATPMGDALDARTQRYWDGLAAQRDRFRRKPQAEECYEAVKKQYAYLLDRARAARRVQYYNNTLEIVVQAISTLSSVAPDGAEPARRLE